MRVWPHPSDQRALSRGERVLIVIVGISSVAGLIGVSWSIATFPLERAGRARFAVSLAVNS